MRKPIAAVLLLFALLLPMTSGAVAQEQPDTLTPPVIQPGPDSVVDAFLPGSVPADAARLDAIRLPVQALAQAMVENDLVYDSTDDAFVWTALYYALSTFGQMDDRAQVTDTALLLPSETAQDYLRALFRDRQELPAIPAMLDGLVTYDSLTDQYALSLGDLGLAQLEPDAPVPAGDGLERLTGTLTSPDAPGPICRVEVLLEANESMFGFAVVEAHII